MGLRVAYIVWWRELRRYMLDRGRMIAMFFQPLMFLIVMGYGINSVFPKDLMGFDYMKFLFPGILAMTVFMTAFMGGITVIWDREFGFLKELMVAPVRPTWVVVGRILGSATVATIQGIIFMIIGYFLGIRPDLMMTLKIVATTFALGIMVGGLGIYMGSAMKTTENFMALMNMIVQPMLFLSGAFFPIDNIPNWLKWFVYVNPLTYAVDLMRHITASMIKIETLSMPQIPQNLPPQAMQALKPIMDMLNSLMSTRPNVTHFSMQTDILVMAGFTVVFVLLAGWKFAVSEGV
ncbi:ABC transporter [bacterium 3DAC]|jgi:ABC-2 type transport system permease protein|nr:ABC transporter permease [Dictyoglomota bacterium]UZN22844.1 ABC transporter [bacterium 3DAC]